MARTYIVTLTAGEDGYIVAECPALPGCVSQGFTREEALKIFKRRSKEFLKFVKLNCFPFPLLT